MTANLMEVTQNIHNYFKDSLPQYTVIEIRRKSHHPDDDYLYMVSAKKTDGSYAVWTSWNENTKCLNHGHYDLTSMESCAKVMAEYQAACSVCPAESATPLQALRVLLMKRDIYFEDPYQELLYITGYVDGIKSQQGHGWEKLTDKNADILFAEALEV